MDIRRRKKYSTNSTVKLHIPAGPWRDGPGTCSATAAARSPVALHDTEKVDYHSFQMALSEIFAHRTFTNPSARSLQKKQSEKETVNGAV